MPCERPIRILERQGPPRATRRTTSSASAAFAPDAVSTDPNARYSLPDQASLPIAAKTISQPPTTLHTANIYDEKRHLHDTVTGTSTDADQAEYRIR